MNEIPYDVKDKQELKERLNLHFEPGHAAHIYRLNSRENCILKFVPPRTSSGTCVDNGILEKLFEDGIINNRYDSAPDIKQKSDIEEDVKV